MGKKYTPSGYQIIDLGNLDLSASVRLNKGASNDVDTLIEIVSNNNLFKKPILLKLKDTDLGFELMVLPIICGVGNMEFIYDDSGDIHVYYISVNPENGIVTVSRTINQ